MTVSNYLPSVKAHKGMYYNLNEQTKKEYQKLYSYLLKNKDKEVWSIATQGEINKITFPYGTYLYKYARMKVIRQHIR